MGIESNTAAFLIAARKSGVSYSRCLTVGRQSLNFGPGSLRAFLSKSGVEISDQDEIFNNDGYAETFLRKLGAEHVESIDNSDYEGATHIFDLNCPISDELKGRYSAVVDSGATEHVFNFPQAIRNCMEMVEVGGHYLGILPANNLCGHGFYQVSPELMFRIFSVNNGFEAERVYITEQVPGARWLRAPDPAVVKDRVEYSGAKPAYIYIRAKRVAETPIFSRSPQQSDYVDYWAAGAGDHSRRVATKSRVANIVGGLPAPVKRALANVASTLRPKRSHLAPVDLFAD